MWYVLSMGIGRAIAVVAAFLGAAAFAACSSSSNQGGSGGGSGAAGNDAGVGYAGSACFACVASTCSAEQTACNADPSCAAYLSCLGSCALAPGGDVSPDCAAGCASANPGGESARTAFETCRTESAAGCVDCGGSPSDGGGKNPILEQTCGPFPNSNACWQCQNEECCESLVALEQPGPNKNLDDCLANCKTAACEIDCVTQYPDGMPAYGGWWACTAVNCVAVEKCTSNSECTKCTYSQCSNEYADCQMDPGCFRIVACVATCPVGSTTCPENCIAQYPGGQSLAGQLTACVNQRCLDQC